MRARTRRRYVSHRRLLIPGVAMLLAGFAAGGSAGGGELDRGGSAGAHRLAEMAPDVMVRMLALGRPKGLPADVVRSELARARVAPGNEASFVRQLEARSNLALIMQTLRHAQAVNPDAVQDLELLWVVNGVTAYTTARLAKLLATRPDVQDVLVDSDVTLVRPTLRRPAPPRGSNWGIAKIGASQAWQDFGAQGQGSLVGLIDTGVDAAHGDLAGRVVKFRNFTKITAPVEPAFDDEGHGTHCAGVVAGGSASGGPIGVAPRARLLVAKGLNKSGAGGVVGLIRAMQWMADPDGSSATRDQPIAVSCSWGANLNIPLISRIFWLSVSSMRDAGVLPVIASGNEGQGKLSVPGSYPHSHAVGSTNSSDAVSDFTSRGTITWSGRSYTKPNVSAPGDFIYSSVPGNKYEHMSGTSMATPHVAGLAALIRSANPRLTAAQIEQIINRSAKDLGTAGNDATFGWGRVDARAAVSLARQAAAGGAAADASPAFEVDDLTAPPWSERHPR
jgi:subtilisin family serine protease